MLDIPRLAREAGLVLRGSGYGTEGDYSVSEAALERFARLVVEEAAKECDATAKAIRSEGQGAHDGRYDWKADGAEDCAAAIREAFGVKR